MLQLSTEMLFKSHLRQKNHVCLFLDVGYMCELHEQVLSMGATVPQPVLWFWLIFCFLCEMIKCKMMYIFLNPPFMIKCCKKGSRIAPINDVILAIWERKRLHGNVQRKPNKQTNLEFSQAEPALLWHNPSNMGVFPLGPIWDVPDGLLHLCWRHSLQECSEVLIPLQKYLRYEI